MNVMKIERANVDDAAEILALQKLAYLTEAELYGDYTIEPLTQTLDGIVSDFSRRTFLKAVEDGAIVGSVRAHTEGGTCFVGKLIVHPEYRNRGIGAALMLELERLHPGAERFELFTGWKSANNLHLYGKLGYRRYKLENATERLKFVCMEKVIAKKQR
jgi:GNAT superfamily N-acetyltransferase